MSDLYLYGLSEATASSFLERVRAAVLAEDTSAWVTLVAGIERLYPRPLLYSDERWLSLSGPPLLRASHYGYYSTPGSLADVDAAHVPEWGDATLAWLLMNVVLHTCRHLEL